MITEEYREMWKNFFETEFDYVFSRRDGHDELYRYLMDEGFCEAPASMKHHLAEPGGLLVHTCNVVRNVMELHKTGRFGLCNYTAAVGAALLHDICKIGRCRKTDTGYIYNDKRMWGHGEESVIMAQQFMRLTDVEIAAIRWHMGAYADPDKLRTMSDAFDKYPEALLVHMADMMATHIDEV